MLRAVSRALEAGTSPVLATAQLERGWCGDRDPELLWAQLLGEGEQLMETLMQLLHTKEGTKGDTKGEPRGTPRATPRCWYTGTSTWGTLPCQEMKGRRRLWCSTFSV